MATCSPRVGCTSACARQARFRRRHIEKPSQARPARAVLAEISDDWETKRAYLTMEAQMIHL